MQLNAVTHGYSHTFMILFVVIYLVLIFSFFLYAINCGRIFFKIGRCNLYHEEFSIMRIGIIGAMDKEIEIIKNKIDSRKDTTITGYEFSTGHIYNNDIVLLRSGIGKVNAAVGTTLLNHCFNCDYIINIGSAGGFCKNLNIGDVVISSEIRNYDVDVTAFGYEFGQVPKMPAFFSSDLALSKLAESCAPVLSPYRIVKGLIVSGDSFMNEIDRITAIRNKFNDILATEMEACAIAQVCYQFKIPYIIIRSISDHVGNDAHIKHDMNLELAAKNSTTVALSLLENIEKHHQERKKLALS